MCFLGLNACLWIVYDLGFRGVVRPEVWAFVSLFLSVFILGGIHFLKDFLRFNASYNGIPPSLLGSGNFIISPTSVLRQTLNIRRIVKDKKYLFIF